MNDIDPQTPKRRSNVILAVAASIVMGIVMLVTTLWNMPSETRFRQLVTVAVVVMAGILAGCLFDRRNRKKRPNTIIRIPGRW